MARSTLSRDFDIGRTLNDFLRRIRALERRLLSIGFAAQSTEVACTTSGGIASANVHAWSAGLTRGITLSFQIGTATHATVIGNVPVGYRPVRTVTIPLVPNGVNPDTSFCWVETNGDITLFMYGATAAGTALRGSSAWVHLVP